MGVIWADLLDLPPGHIPLAIPSQHYNHSQIQMYFRIWGSHRLVPACFQGRGNTDPG